MLCLLVATAVNGLLADSPAKVFSRPMSIRYDGQCLTVHERDVFIFSAAFPFQDIARPKWPARFEETRRAGFNAVEASLPARASAMEASDFETWLKMATDQFGLYVIAEPAPGAESWCYPAIAKAEVTRRPPGTGGVVLARLSIARETKGPVFISDREDRLRALYRRTAKDMDVPLFTEDEESCRDSYDPELSQVFDSVELRRGFEIAQGKMDALESAQPDAPEMVEIRGAHSPSEAEEMTLFAIGQGATIVNFDPEAGSAAEGAGGFEAIAPVGRMLDHTGRLLARAHPVQHQIEAGSDDVTMAMRRYLRTTLFFFFCNHSATEPRRGIAVIWGQGNGEIRVNYDLRPAGVEVLKMSIDALNATESGRSVPASRRADGQPQKMPLGLEWLP